MQQHFLGMVARGLKLDHHRAARRIEAGEQHGRFDLRRGDGGRVFDGQRLAGSLQQDREATALLLLQHAGALEQQRVEDAPHRPLAQRGVAVETRGDGMAADDAHHQPRSRAGVAEVERLAGAEQRAQSRAEDAPISLAAPRHGRAKLAAGAGGVENVIAFEQTLDRRLADAKQPEDQRPMRDGFVAGRAKTSG